MSTAGREKVVLLGMMSKMPVAGVVWQTLHYLLGVDLLGFEAYYVEAHARTPSMMMTRPADDSSAIAASFIAAVMHRFGFDRRWAFQALHSDGRCYGVSSGELTRLYADAACVINLHGGTEPLPEHSHTGRLVYLETDPVQLQAELSAGDRSAFSFLEAHRAHFSFAENWGRPDCLLPTTDAFHFEPTRQPVVVDLWEPGGTDPEAAFTTVGNWDQRWRNVVLDGETYLWSKKHEFFKFIDLPRRCDAAFELALAGCEAEDRNVLESHGWGVRSADDLSASIDEYRAYVRRSLGEFTVAKDQNVRLRSGWFSDRSASYLAAGKPVVTQDTGFGSVLPTGKGLFAFSTLEEAAEATARVRAEPDRHALAARDLAREYFAHDVVLPPILASVGLSVRRLGALAGRAAERDRTVMPTCLPANLVIEPIGKHPVRLPPATEAHVMASTHVGAITEARHPPIASPQASVVVVTWEAPVLTRLCLESILANTDGPAFEVVVVDNASHEATADYLRHLPEVDPRVVLIRNDTNTGFPAAANTGLAAARGDVVALLNSDTIVPPGWLYALAGHLDDPSIGMVGPLTNETDGPARIPTAYTTYGQFLAFAAQRARDGAMTDVDMLTMFCVALRRDVYEHAGPLDDSFGLGLFEDDDYARRLRRAGYRLVCAEDVFVHHFGRGSFGALVASGEYGELFERNRARFERKWDVAWERRSGRDDPGYRQLVDEVVKSIERAVPAGATVAVATRGDDALLALSGRSARHFPSAQDGSYAGYYPADGEAAVRQVRELRGTGCTHLALPHPAAWWLDRFPELGEHLRLHARRLDTGTGPCLIFELIGDRGDGTPPSPGAGHRVGVPAP